MDVILHLGAHRTGATTLQHFLTANAGALAESGTVTWTPPQTRQGMMAGLVKRPDRISMKEEKRGRRSVGVMRTLMEILEDDGVDRLIVSEPNMIGTRDHNIKTKRLYPWLGERLDRFAPAFFDRCTRVALVIRSYDTYWRSVLNAAVIDGFPMPSEELRDHLVTQPMRWKQAIEDVARVFPQAQLVVWPFEALVAQPERQLGILTDNALPATRFSATREWKNGGPRPQYLAEVLADRGEPEMAAKVLAQVGARRWEPFTSDQREALCAEYQDDLAWLRSGASGLATFVDEVDMQDPPATDRMRGWTDDASKDPDRLESAG